MMLDDFAAAVLPLGETGAFVRSGGAGPPLLLLHGFPQTHLMWRIVAPLLARSFTVVCADLRGYGRSGCPPSAPDHAPYAKRAMAHDMAAVMSWSGSAFRPSRSSGMTAAPIASRSTTQAAWIDY